MSDKFTPTPEMIEACAQGVYKAYPLTSTIDNSPAWSWEQAKASSSHTAYVSVCYARANAVLAIAIPMIAEECAKMALKVGDEAGCMVCCTEEKIAIAIRAKFSAP